MNEADIWAKIRTIEKPEDIGVVDSLISRAGIAYPANLVLLKELDSKAAELFPEFANIVEAEIQAYIHGNHYSRAISGRIANMLKLLDTLAGPGHETKRRKRHWKIYELSWKMPKSPEEIVADETIARL
jgi:hypothetical protein